MNGAAGGAAGASAAAAAAAHRRVIAGAVRVKVAIDVFEQIAAHAEGPVVRVRGLFAPTWWVISGGFAFRARGNDLSLPAGIEVIAAESAE